MNKSLFFLSCDQPCFGGNTATGTAAGTPASTIICDDRLVGLVVIPKVELLGIKPGSNCLARMLSRRGFVFNDGLGFYVEDHPALSLPVLNLNDSSQVIAGTLFPYLLAGTGTAPNPWKFLGAPATGAFVIQALNGSFSLVDAANMVAVGAICASSTAAAIIPAGCSADGFRKLAITVDRALVGFNDGGTSRVRSLPDDQPLKHPRGDFDVLSPKTIQARADDGTDIPGGLPVMQVSGSDAVNDGVALVFSPTTKKLYRAPARVAYYVSTSTVVNMSAAAGYTVLAGGHGVSAAQTFNYPRAMISASIGFNADEDINLALFRDGTLLHEFPYRSVQNVTLQYLDLAIPIGSHSYDIRIKKDPGVTASAASTNIFYSDVSIISLP